MNQRDKIAETIHAQLVHGAELECFDDCEKLANKLMYCIDQQTLLDQFAMAALTGLLGDVTACNEIRKIDQTKITQNMAVVCFSYADSMLKAREKDSEQ